MEQLREAQQAALHRAVEPVADPAPQPKAKKAAKAKKAPEDRAERRSPQQLLEDEQKRWAADEERRQKIAEARAAKAAKLKERAEKIAKNKEERAEKKARHRERLEKQAAETVRQRRARKFELQGEFIEPLLLAMASSSNPAERTLVRRLASELDAKLKRDADRELFKLAPRTDLSREERGLPPEEEKPAEGGTSDA